MRGRGGGGRGGITINMPIQAVGLNQADCQKVAQMVISEIKKQLQLNSVASA
jgi:hypothetical protein